MNIKIKDLDVQLINFWAQSNHFVLFEFRYNGDGWASLDISLLNFGITFQWNNKKKLQGNIKYYGITKAYVNTGDICQHCKIGKMAYRRVWVKGHWTHTVDSSGRKRKWVIGYWRKVRY